MPSFIRPAACLAFSCALLVAASLFQIAVCAQQTATPAPAASAPAAAVPTPDANAKQEATEPAAPPYRISYRLSMPNPNSHLFVVTMTIDTLQPVEFVDVQMPRWSPGRYSVFNFAANVQGVKANDYCPDGDCEVVILPVTRMDDQTWRIETKKRKQIEISYKVFGNDLSGTFSQLNSRHANFNGGSVFMYVVGHKPDAVSLHIEPPEGWRIANGRMMKDDQRDWSFPNYDEMIDTPTEIAPDFTVDEFKVDNKTYRVMTHSFGDEGGKRAALVKDIEKIVRAETALWGAPEFDSYTFLLHFANDGYSGDGMEHLTSTNIIEPGKLADADTYERTLGAVAHEFFHVWNVKRLRPVELGPWDFTRPVATRGLWIAEGLTNYYGHLMQRRSGVWKDERFLQNLGATISGIENAPGARLMSAEESSLSAPLLDGAPFAQNINLANTSISYYPKGELLGLNLDLLIRGRTNGAKSLDDVMRRMYEEFYLKSSNSSYYLRGRGYMTEDFERVATEVAGFDLSEFFRRYVRGRETPPYDEAFKAVGLRLVKNPSSEPFTAGIVVDGSDAQNPRIAVVRENSAAERAGLTQGDVLLTIGKTNVTAPMWRNALNLYKPGERIPITVRRDRRVVNLELQLDSQPDVYEYHLEEMKDATPDQSARRAAWLNGKHEAEAPRAKAKA